MDKEKTSKDELKDVLQKVGEDKRAEEELDMEEFPYVFRPQARITIKELAEVISTIDLVIDEDTKSKLRPGAARHFIDRKLLKNTKK